MPVTVLVFMLSGCGDDDEPSAEPTTDEAAQTSPPAPCDLIDEADVEAAFGEPVPAGTVGVGGNTENDVAWESKNCDWEQDGVLEVQLALAEAGDFNAGEVLCPELKMLGTLSTAVTDLGEEAYWVADERTEAEGQLRICTDDLLIDLEVEAPIGSRDLETLRGQTITLGRVVLDELG